MKRAIIALALIAMISASVETKITKNKFGKK